MRSFKFGIGGDDAAKKKHCVGRFSTILNGVSHHISLNIHSG